MKPIKIEPGSGTKMAGKWIMQMMWPNGVQPIQIIFVSDSYIFFRDTNNNQGTVKIQDVWFEVDPPAPKVQRLGGRIGRSNIFNSSENVFWRDDIPPLPIVIVQEDGKEIRGKMFVEVPEEGERK